MAVRVFHGTNTRLYAQMRRKGRIAPTVDPLLERIKRVAMDVGVGYRVTMLGREPAIYVASKETVAEGYSASSPEILITSINLIREASPEQAKEIIRELQKEGWLDIKPIVLEIEIRHPSELGLVDDVLLIPSVVEAAAGSTDQLTLVSLSTDRIKNVRKIEDEHILIGTAKRMGLV